MNKAVTDIINWISTRPFWEQAAFDKILSNATLLENDYAELVRLLEEDCDLCETKTAKPKLECLTRAQEIATTEKRKITLEKVGNVQNVNALVPGQALAFNDKLTIIFGANGSGKSGYARILSTTCFTRGERSVLPDITKPAKPGDIINCDIEISNGSEKQTIHYDINDTIPELANFYTFDSTSIQAHLTGDNSFSFSPVGLEWLTKLASLTDEVRRRLKEKAKSLMPNNFGRLFTGESEITDIILRLGADTDLQKLKELAKRETNSTQRIEELAEELQQIKLLDIATQIADIKRLKTNLEQVESNLQIDVIIQELKSYKEKLDTASRQSIDQFKTDKFKSIGTAEWTRFIQAAASLANTEGSHEEPYPQKSSHCLLCQQELTEEARILLNNLLVFIQSDIQDTLKQAETNLKKRKETLSKIGFDFFSEQTALYRNFKNTDAELLDLINKYIAKFLLRKQTIIEAIDSVTIEKLIVIKKDDDLKFEDILEKLDKTLAELQNGSVQTQIERGEKELRQLQHKEILGNNINEIEKYVATANIAKKAMTAGGNTAPITRKYNELFNQLVTQQYIKLFNNTLKDLKRKLNIKIDTSGSKGETLKRILVEHDPGFEMSNVKITKVLSEGEKRAVALADFLTEVELDENSAGIILDDPVTSLDLDWREVIASILAGKATTRQVIIFTHDLPFVYFLRANAERQKVEISTHWIKRGDDDDKPGYVYLDNCPSLEKDYKSAEKARQCYSTVTKATMPEQQERILRDGFGALRTSYEALVIFEVFNGVVSRFEERVSMDRLKEVKWDKTIIDSILDRYAYLSGLLEGHLHSDIFKKGEIKPSTLLTEIETFEKIKSSLKQLKN